MKAWTQVFLWTGLTTLGFGCSKSDAASEPPVAADPRTEVILPPTMPQEILNGHPYLPILVEHRPSNSTKWTFDKTRVLFNMTDFTPDLSLASYREKVNRYGSRTDVQPRQATGRFRTEKINGRWWIIDPDGYLHLYRGVATFKPGPTDANRKALAQKFGTEKLWVSMAASDLRNLGFIGAGAFSSPYTHILEYNDIYGEVTPIVYAPSFGFLASTRQMASLTYPDGTSTTAIGLVFYPGFADLVKRYAAQALQSYKGDRNLLGIYSDNEIVFSSVSTRILRAFLALEDQTNPAAQAAVAFMTEKGFSATAAAFDALTKTEQETLNDEFAGMAAEKYYKMCRDAIKAVDPEMMYLGSRLHGVPKTMKSVVRAAGMYCDIVSINYYGEWTPDLNTTVAEWREWTADKPLIATEFYAMAEDSHLGNDEGAGYVVWEQSHRACFYQTFCLSLLEAKNFIGWDWFKYQDDEDVNKGLYGNDYTRWAELGQYMKDLNTNAYKLIDYFDGVKR